MTYRTEKTGNYVRRLSLAVYIRIMQKRKTLEANVRRIINADTEVTIRVHKLTWILVFQDPLDTTRWERRYLPRCVVLRRWKYCKVNVPFLRQFRSPRKLELQTKKEKRKHYRLFLMLKYLIFSSQVCVYLHLSIRYNLRMEKYILGILIS